MPEKLSPALKIRYEIEISICLEAEFESNKERGFQRALEDIALADRVGYFLFRYDLLFREDLHSIDALGILLADLENLSKGSSSDKLEEFKVTGCQGSLRLWKIEVGYNERVMQSGDRPCSAHR